MDMPKKYLGEFPVSPGLFATWTTADWALYFINRYGGIDGGHHKTWILDQVARILHGSPVHVVEARWDNGDAEYRVSVGASAVYRTWVEGRKSDGDDWDGGVAP
jgi:hypothetical protein